MNETLNVIDEHITDLNTPRHSVSTHERQLTSDSASEYSSHQDNRLSYVAGPETDEEDEGQLTENQVRSWDHKQAAQYLRSVGMDPHHCDIFEEQEISGEVLLEMDQSFVYMKEYNFGVMGKRLKTWHKIRDLQQEAKGLKSASQSRAGRQGSLDEFDRSHSRVGHSGTFLPRIPSLIDKSSASVRQSRQQTPPNMYSSMSIGQAVDSPSNTRAPSSNWASGQESPRPSAASIRDINHSRRHSSIDASVDSYSRVTALSGKTLGTHQKQPSFDRNWSMSSAVPTLNTVNTPPISSLNQAMNQDLNSSDPNLLNSSSLFIDSDRGYFSGGEVENRKARNVLRKRESGTPTHSRHSSLIEDPQKSMNALKRHSRFGSADSIRDLVPIVTSPAAKAYHSNASKGRFRSASTKSAASAPLGGAASPTVTNLEGSEIPSPGSFMNSAKPDSGRSSPLPSLASKSGSSKNRRIVGLRAISDAVTGHEKSLVSSPNSIPSPIKEDQPISPTRTGSSTPSAASKSFDNDTTDASSKGTDPPVTMPPPKAPVRGKTKSKKETSAYIRGLQKKTPAEARVDCDYSGWMKKKSSSLITTWKPRLFILKGRRLSYYYTEDDTEERGVIDISSHKVLSADQDTIMTLHATITGSTSSPVSPQSVPGSAGLDEKASAARKMSASDGPFFFKLVPPRVGLSKAVQFTKPTVHYFQVDSVDVGRKWMAEILKATIDHRPEQGFETTNKQKTISLAKARARKERPPALQGEENKDVAEGPKSDETGLNIQGLGFDSPDDSMQNGSRRGHKQQSSLEAVGAYMNRSEAEFA